MPTFRREHQRTASSAVDSSHSEIRPPRKPNVLLALSLILPLSLYIAFASRLITAHVGYQMDEAIYVESAVFMLRGVPDHAGWIATHGRRWPLMIHTSAPVRKSSDAATSSIGRVDDFRW